MSHYQTKLALERYVYITDRSLTRTITPRALLQKIVVLGALSRHIQYAEALISVNKVLLSRSSDTPSSHPRCHFPSS